MAAFDLRHATSYDNEMNRRTFLETSIAAAAASALPTAALAQRKLGAIGVQFYSVAT